jgi:hypothetical protein
MRRDVGIALCALAFAALASGQAQPTARPVGMAQPTPAPEALLEIYQIDLVPSGFGFAFGQPKLQDNVYVMTVWPDRATIRVPKERVAKITPRTTELSTLEVYRIDLLPSGRMIARDNPTLKNGTYVFHTWREGTIMSLRQADVRAVSRVTGLDAFKIQQEEKGAKLIGNLPMEGGGTVITLPGDAPAAPDPGAQSTGVPAGVPGNWIFYGTPGVTDAFAPPSAVVSSPGDVPKAAPTPRSR